MGGRWWWRRRKGEEFMGRVDGEGTALINNTEIVWINVYRTQSWFLNRRKGKITCPATQLAKLSYLSTRVSEREDLEGFFAVVSKSNGEIVTYSFEEVFQERKNRQERLCLLTISYHNSPKPFSPSLPANALLYNSAAPFAATNTGSPA